MKHNSPCFYECPTYGWTKDNLKMSQPMFSHLNHHLNNGLTVAIGKLQSILKDSPDGCQRDKLETALGKLHEMTSYVKSLDEFVKE